MVTRVARRLRAIRGAIRGGLLVTGGVAVTTIVVIVTAIGGGGGGTGTANLFVSTGGGATCTRQASATSFAGAAGTAKCASFDAAYQAASMGDTVLVEAGTYGGQAFNPRTASSPGVTFTPDGTAAVTLTGGLSTGDVGNNVAGANWWKVLGKHQITATGFDIEIATNITLDSIAFAHTFNANADLAYISAGTDITVSNSDLCCTGDNSKILLMDAFRGADTRITLDGDAFHDQQQTNDANHFECIYANGVQGLTITRSIFYGCKSTGDMLVTVSGAGTPQPINLDIENTIFEPGADSTGSTTSAGGFSIQDPTVNMPVSGFVLKNNLWTQTPPDISNGTTSSGITLVNNAGATDVCYAGNTYIKDTWTNVSCPGDNAVNANVTNSSFYVNAAAHNWHYTGTNPLIDAGSASGSSVDRDGHTRPFNGIWDLGPYEFGSS